MSSEGVIQMIEITLSARKLTGKLWKAQCGGGATPPGLIGGRKASASAVRVTSAMLVQEENNHSICGQITLARALPISNVNSI
jgi:hypothetical protein